MMATKKTGVLVGIAAIAVIGVAAVLYFSQWPPAEEDATGAIGAAERYRAEQITDEDVILDIPGQEDFAAAVFDQMTDEQKAEMLDIIGESGRNDLLDRFEGPEAFDQLSARQKTGLFSALSLEAQEKLAAGIRLEARDFQRMDPAIVASALDRADEASLDRAFASLKRGEFAALSANQKFGYFNAFDFAAQETLAGSMRLEARDFQRMDPAIAASALDRADAANLDRAFAALKRGGGDYAQLSINQKAGWVNAFGSSACERSVLKVRAFNRLDTNQQRRVWERLGGRGQEAALRYAGVESNLARGSFDHRRTEFEKYLSERSARGETR